MIVRWSRWTYFAMTALWLIVIAYGSVDPRPVEAGPPGLPGSSAVAHLGAYAVLGFLWLGSMKAAFTKPLRWVPAPVAAWSLATIYGIAMEMVQLALPRRDASMGDVGWNALGAVIGLVALALWRATHQSRHLGGGTNGAGHRSRRS